MQLFECTCISRAKRRKSRSDCFKDRIGNVSGESGESVGITVGASMVTNESCSDLLRPTQQHGDDCKTVGGSVRE